MKTTKQRLFSLMMLIASMVSMTILPSCSDKDDSGEKKEAESSTLRVTPGSLRFDASGGTKSLNVYTDYEYLEADLHADWLDYDYGSNSLIINVTAKPNTSSKSREATLTLMGSNNRNTTEERVTIKIEQDAGSGGNGQTFTIGPNGGKVEYDDLTIDFPSGTFDSETTITVEDMEKGSVRGEDEVSKFYKVTLPLITKKPLNVTIKCNETDGDICFIAHAPVVAFSAGEYTYGNVPLKSTYSNGCYTAELPASAENDEEAGNSDITFGLVRIPQNEKTSARTRAKNDDVDGTVGNVSWKLMKVHPVNLDDNLFGCLYDNLNKYITEALTILQKDLGLAVSGTRCIPIEFEYLSQGTDGEFCQSPRGNQYSVVKFDIFKVALVGSPNVADHSTMRKAIIHELMHYYQSDYDKRCAFMKWSRPAQEQMIMWESGAVWSEKLMSNGAFSYNFVGDNIRTLLRSLECRGEVWNIADEKRLHQQHGYTQSFFLEYVTQQKGDNSIATLYKDWHDTGKTTFECLKRWTPKLMENNIGFNEYLLDAAQGRICSQFDVTGIITREDLRIANKNGTYTFDISVYPYGGEFRMLRISSDYMNDKGEKTLKGAKITVKQNSYETNCHFLTKNPKTKEWIALGSVYGEEPLVISGDDIQKLRELNSAAGNYPNFPIYFLCANSSNYEKVSATVSITIEEDNELKIDPDHLEFTADGGEKTAEFTKGNYKYCGSVIEYKDNQKDWLESWFGAAESGATKLTANIIASPNTSTTARSAIITYWASDVENPSESQKKKVTLTVTQEGKTGKNYSWIKEVSMSISKCDLYYNGNQYEDGIKNNKNIKIPRYYDSDYYKLGGHTDVTETANLIKVVYEYNYENGYLKSCKIELEIDPVKKIVTKISAKERDLSFADKPSGDHYVLTIEAANIPLKTEKSNSIEAVGSNKSGATLIKINEEGKSGWAEWEQYWPGSGDYEIMVKLSE